MNLRLAVLMKSRRLIYLSLSGLALVAGLSTFAGCSKSSDNSAPAVPAAGQSPTTATISSHLESGGELFAVVDVKGDVDQASNLMADFAGYAIKQATGAMGGGGPLASLDTRSLVNRLGFSNIDGFGLSSWKDTDGVHHNRSFLYTPRGRTGLLKVFGGSPSPFVTPGLAPADADLAFESTVDLKSLYDLILSYVKDIGGPAAVQEITDNLKEPIPGTTITGQSLIDHLNTRGILIARADTKQILQAGPSFKMPMTDFLIGLDGFSDVLDQLEPLLKSQPFFTFSEKNGMKVVTIDFPIPDPFAVYKPIFISDPKTKRLYIVSRESFANETVFGQGARLSTSDDFKAATDGLPTEGNSLSYFSKKGAAAFVQYYDRQMLADVPPALRDSVIDFGGLEKIPHGLAMTQVNLPDGIMVQGASTRSAKDIILIAPVAAVAVVGVMAAGGMQGYNTARAMSTVGTATTSQDQAIRNNLRMITSAAQQYMLDKGVTEVRYQDLVSGPSPLIPPAHSFAGEDYSNLIIRQTSTRITVTTASGQVISYDL